MLKFLNPCGFLFLSFHCFLEIELVNRTCPPDHGLHKSQKEALNMLVTWFIIQLLRVHLPFNNLACLHRQIYRPGIIFRLHASPSSMLQIVVVSLHEVLNN